MKKQLPPLADSKNKKDMTATSIVNLRIMLRFPLIIMLYATSRAVIVVI
jgi:hypothetical protein